MANPKNNQKTQTLLEKYGFYEEERFEEGVGFFVNTDYPKPGKRFKLLLEKNGQNVEEAYYWIMNFLRHGPIGGFNEIVKVKDVFSASEQSSFFGASQSRLGLQQDKVSQFLATIGKMVKELFQLVRELRILDERLELYHKSGEGEQASEIALKGYWIDLVEGGAKNPASVYGMARELQFGTLPDLFFGSKVLITADEVDEYVDGMTDFNSKVREVLKRKLKTYLVWKKHTLKEHNDRRIFTLKYLRQHWDVINMYMNWAKPYLNNIKRMGLRQKDVDRNPELVSAFEGSIVELEYLATNIPKKSWSGHMPILLVSFWYRTMPKMDFHQQEYQHKGPIHIGKLIIDFRSYSWTKKELEDYLAMREEENFELLGTIDGSVKAAMEALGSELRDYLIEAGEKELLPPEEKKSLKEKKKKPTDNPFLAVAGGFGELFGSLAGINSPGKDEKKKPKEKSNLQKFKEKGIKKKGQGLADTNAWNLYKNFKKAHKMLAW